MGGGQQVFFGGGSKKMLEKGVNLKKMGGGKQGDKKNGGVQYFFEERVNLIFFFKNFKKLKTRNVIKTKNCVITCQYLWYANQPEVSTTSGRGCFELSQTHWQTHRHTNMAPLWLNQTSGADSDTIL